jgi:hypothetical protein
LHIKTVEINTMAAYYFYCVFIEKLARSDGGRSLIFLGVFRHATF